jgi:hypothetical protein
MRLLKLSDLRKVLEQLYGDEITSLNPTGPELDTLEERNRRIPTVIAWLFQPSAGDVGVGYKVIDYWWTGPVGLIYDKVGGTAAYVNLSGEWNTQAGEWAYRLTDSPVNTKAVLTGYCFFCTGVQLIEEAGGAVRQAQGGKTYELRIGHQCKLNTANSGDPNYYKLVANLNQTSVGGNVKYASKDDLIGCAGDRGVMLPPRRLGLISAGLTTNKYVVTMDGYWQYVDYVRGMIERGP